MTLALFFLPDEWIPVVIVGIGILLILGILTRSKALSLTALLLGLVLITPFMESLVNSMDTWMLLLIMIGVGFYLFRAFLTLLIGSEATGSFIGRLVYDLFALPFRILGGLFRMITYRGSRR